MRTMLSLAAAIALVSACGVVEDMKGAFEKAQLVAKAIKDRHGWDTQVGWNIHNGRLTQVTVTFQASDVREQKVAVLETAAAEAIVKAFAAQPEMIFVQIASQPGN